MRYSIEKETLEKIVGYLCTKSYSEVANLINLINQDLKIIEGESKETNEV